VTFDDENDELKGFAMDYTQDIIQELKNKNSPIDFLSKFVPVPRNTLHQNVIIRNTESLNADEVFIICFLDRNSDENYKKIRSYCTAKGMLSQCINAQRGARYKKMKNRAAIMDNILTQIINKYYGLLWYPTLNSLPNYLNNKKVLIVGIDVHHKPIKYVREEGSFKRKRSLCGFVALFFEGRKISHFNDVSIKTAGEEIIGGRRGSREDDTQAIGKFIKDAIASFENKKPDIIVIYRDGVAESMFDQVGKNEVLQVTTALDELNINLNDLDLVYTVIQKKVNVRFIAKDTTNKFCNPPSGTIVEDGTIRTSSLIENRLLTTQSFFLVPAFCDLSTVKPVNYTIIQIEGVRNLIPLNELQQFTFYTCYLYPNWTDSVKSPVVTMMAHKSSYTLGENLSEDFEVHNNLRGKMFYL